jgi:hypothetical protein
MAAEDLGRICAHVCAPGAAESSGNPNSCSSLLTLISESCRTLAAVAARTCRAESERRIESDFEVAGCCVRAEADRRKSAGRASKTHVIRGCSPVSHPAGAQPGGEQPELGREDGVSDGRRPVALADGSASGRSASGTEPGAPARRPQSGCGRAASSALSARRAAKSASRMYGAAAPRSTSYCSLRPGPRVDGA